MTEHVQSVAEQHGVEVHWTARSWDTAEAWPGGTPRVSLPKIRAARDYLASLHEIGHCVDPNALRMTNAAGHYENVLCESAAWAWAMEQVAKRFVRHIRAEDWNFVAYGWRTYLAEGTGWNRSHRKRTRDLLPRGPVQPRETLGPVRHRPL